MPVVAGIDCGTAFTKAVVVAQFEGERPHALAKGMVKSAVDREASAAEALAAALADAGMNRAEVEYVATTGFGRHGISFRDIQITEITSAARGAQFLFPDSDCVLDVGGQSTRAIALRDGWKVRAFKMNDKCAAGSGMFIARAARYLEIGIEQVGPLSMRAATTQPISSICAVLAESEIINHVSAGVSVEDILRGIHESLADRAALLLRRAGIGERVVFIGGVALQEGMVDALRKRLGIEVRVPENPEYVCALGAALLGMSRLARARCEERHTAAS